MIVPAARLRPPAPASLRPRGRLLAVALVAVLAATGFVAGRGAVSSLALLTSAASSGGNVLTAGRWASDPVTWYLHNSPTPPRGSTMAQEPLSMDVTVPTATSLANYDTDQDKSPGRSIQVGTLDPRQGGLAYHIAWSSGPLAAERYISGQVIVGLWTATANFRTGRTGSLTAYVRDRDPATGVYVEIGSATRTTSNWQRGSSTWVAASIMVPVAGTVVPKGHVIEVKVESGPASSTAMWVAYDTTQYASSVMFP